LDIVIKPLNQHRILLPPKQILRISLLNSKLLTET